MVPPYGCAIQEPVASGDLYGMKTVARDAEEYVATHCDVAAVLELLRIEVARLEHRAGRAK